MFLNQNGYFTVNITSFVFRLKYNFIALY